MTLFLDAWALIYRFEGARPIGLAVLDLIARLTARQAVVEGVVSRWSLLACRVKPLREGNDPLFKTYDDVFAAIHIWPPSSLRKPLSKKQHESRSDRSFQIANGSTSTTQRIKPRASGKARLACSTVCHSVKKRCKAARLGLSTSIWARSTLATR